MPLPFSLSSHAPIPCSPTNAPLRSRLRRRRTRRLCTTTARSTCTCCRRPAPWWPTRRWTRARSRRRGRHPRCRPSPLPLPPTTARLPGATGAAGPDGAWLAKHCDRQPDCAAPAATDDLDDSLYPVPRVRRADPLACEQRGAAIHPSTVSHSSICCLSSLRVVLSANFACRPLVRNSESGRVPCPAH